MLFNSFDFLIFFSSFFLLYWLSVKNVKHQNIILLIGSYVFYSFTDWRFLLLLISISTLNYFLGLYIEKAFKYKRLLMYIGLAQGIGILAFFKYFNFFINSTNDIINVININFNLKTLNILIPLGISFFTFRTISYVLDVYNEKIKATKDWIVFFNYISFFPSILSGPIDKVNLLVPQIEKKRSFNYNDATNGMRQILWGLFKKIVIADNCSIFVNEIFDNYSQYSGSTLLLGAVFFSFQLYADFSGYSDMAIGFSRLIGFKITKNFNFPFFSQNIAEFWRKWHISLTSWLTEYVFSPLSFNFRRYGKRGLIFAIIINFIICGIWHGANWTYGVFGFIHGCAFIPLIVNNKLIRKEQEESIRFFFSFKELINMISVFTFVTFTFIIFRSDNITHSLLFLSKIFSVSFFLIPETPSFWVILLVFIFLLLEWNSRRSDYVLDSLLTNLNRISRWIVYLFFVVLILYYAGVERPFLYFQF